MKTLRMLTAGMLLAAAATAATAAEEATIPTITLTAKRMHALALAVERVPPQTPIVVTVLLPTDMPEAQIDTHLLAIGVLPAPSQE
jgi:hypothetical protein